MILSQVDPETTRKYAAFYRARGFNPLPSRLDAKRPLVRFAQWWDTPAPADLFDRFGPCNIQVMTGRRWRLLAIDLDGPEAVEWWKAKAKGREPRTWRINSRTSGQGCHLWYRLPADYPRPLPKAVLWRGDGEHAAVERLCDRSLVMAPPSIHPTTGQRYSPLASDDFNRVIEPAPCPAWVLELPTLVPLRPACPVGHIPAPVRVARTGKRYDVADVLDAIPDKVRLAESWGLRLASSRPNAAGWHSCHAIGREDRHPSASLSTSGWYWEPAMRPIGLLDLAVALGRYATWQDAVSDLGSLYIGSVS